MKSFFSVILLSVLMISHLHASNGLVYLFVHGLGSTYQQIDLFQPLMEQQQGIYSFSFDDAKSEGAYHAHLVNLGQERDLQALHNAYQAVLAKEPDGIILIGLSRGAATCINYISRFSPDRLKAVILDSAFDSFSNLVAHIMHRFNVSYLPLSWGKKIATMHFKLVDPEGIFPIQSIEDFPPHVPVLLVHARNDAVVPFKSSCNLYVRLLEKGHEHAYLYEVPHGLHGKLLKGDFQHDYAALVHAFYRKHALAYHAELAQLGEPLLVAAQPSKQQIESRLKEMSQPMQKYPLIEPILSWFAHMLTVLKKILGVIAA